MSDERRCREAARFARIDAAIRGGRFHELQTALDAPADFPNTPGPLGMGNLLGYAIYHAPIEFIRELIDAGADVNYTALDGFPALIAAISATPCPGYNRRTDRYELITLLLERGADIERRGLNDCTPLHWAAATGERRVVELLLAHGADVFARTRIDDLENAREMAERGGHAEVARLLAEQERSVSRRPTT